VNYFRYVDDILLIFDSNHKSIQAVLTDFNSIHPHLHFTAETKQNKTIQYNTIHYLDFSDVFDLVPQDRLLTKIEATAVDLKVVVWVKEILLGRS